MGPGFDKHSGYALKYNSGLGLYHPTLNILHSHQTRSLGDKRWRMNP